MDNKELLQYLYNDDKITISIVYIKKRVGL